MNLQLEHEHSSGPTNSERDGLPTSSGGAKFMGLISRGRYLGRRCLGSHQSTFLGVPRPQSHLSMASLAIALWQ